MSYELLHNAVRVFAMSAGSDRRFFLLQQLDIGSLPTDSKTM